MSADTPKRLGRGLEALLATSRQPREVSPIEGAYRTGPDSDLKLVRISEITPNHFQPRRTFRDEELTELEASIRANGLLQPITVRQKGGGWELVAGERRLRAATRLGWTEIPAVVRDYDDRAMLTLALVENLQRSDLNAMEEADGYQRLVDEFGLTQQQVADVVGKDRTTVTNLLRLRGLPEAVRKMVEEGQLSTGHARALLAIRDERRLLHAAHTAVARHWSVRDVEAFSREQGETSKARKRVSDKVRPQHTEPNVDPALRRLEEQLRKKLQTDVSVQQTGPDRGSVRIAFYGADDLERLMDLLIGARSDFD